MPKKLSAMYCKRHDEAGTRGWQVQVPGRPSEFIADSKHGGPDGAFREARQRAAALADTSRVNLKTGRFVRSRSAADGVFRVVVKRVCLLGRGTVAGAGEEKAGPLQCRKVGREGSREDGARRTRYKDCAIVELTPFLWITRPARWWGVHPRQHNASFSLFRCAGAHTMSERLV